MYVDLKTIDTQNYELPIMPSYILFAKINCITGVSGFILNHICTFAPRTLYLLALINKSDDLLELLIEFTFIYFNVTHLMEWKARTNY